MSDSEYITTAEAVSSLSQQVGGRDAAITAILDGLLGGVVRAMGEPQKEAFVSAGVRLSRDHAGDLKPQSNLVGVQHIPVAFWESATAEDRSKWSWSSGHFQVSARRAHRSTVPEELAGKYHREYLNVELDRRDIASMILPRSADRDQVEKIKRRGGRPRNETWNEWVTYLALTAADGDVQGKMTDSDLIKKIAERMAEDGLDELPRTTVQTAVAALLEVFRRKGL